MSLLVGASSEPTDLQLQTTTTLAAAPQVGPGRFTDDKLVVGHPAGFCVVRGDSGVDRFLV